MAIILNFKMFILLSDDGCMLKIDDGKGNSVDYDHTALKSSLIRGYTVC